MTTELELKLSSETVKKAEEYAKSKGYKSWEDFTTDDVRVLFFSTTEANKE